jgi:hypothetical protein
MRADASASAAPGLPAAPLRLRRCARNGACHCTAPRHPAAEQGVSNMGKYLLAWILGVPAFVLVLVYFFAH